MKRARQPASDEPGRSVTECCWAFADGRDSAGAGGARTGVSGRDSRAPCRSLTESRSRPQLWLRAGAGRAALRTGARPKWGEAAGAGAGASRSPHGCLCAAPAWPGPPVVWAGCCRSSLFLGIWAAGSPRIWRQCHERMQVWITVLSAEGDRGGSSESECSFTPNRRRGIKIE